MARVYVSACVSRTHAGLSLRAACVCWVGGGEVMGSLSTCMGLEALPMRQDTTWRP
jgi:hypothetical protein